MIKKSDFVFYLIAALTTAIGVAAPFFLPEKYFFDANLIVNDPYNEKGFIGSYSFSMWFYDFFKLNRLHYSVISLIQLPLIFYLLKKLGLPNDFSKLTLKNILIWSGLLIFSLYISMPSKEFINIIYSIIIAYVLIKPYKLWVKVIIASGMFIFFGVFFRPYFILMPFLALVIFLSGLIKFKYKVVSNLFAGLVFACFISLSYGILKGEFMSEGSREKFNKVRIGREDSQTIILSPFGSETFITESFSIFYGFFTVNFPVNGLRFYYKPQVLAFIIWQVFLLVMLLYYYNKCYKNKQQYKHQMWVFHFLMAYLVIQGIFEPDLGSAIRHKLGVFPLIYLSLYYNKGLIKTPYSKK